MNRFLQEENIVKKAEPPAPEVVEEEPAVLLPPDSPPKPERPAPQSKKVQKKPVKAQAESAFSRAEVLRDLLQKAQVQRLSREVEIEVYHRLYREARSTEERKRFERTYESLGDDLKFLDLKVKVIQEMLNEKGGGARG